MHQHGQWGIVLTVLVVNMHVVMKKENIISTNPGPGNYNTLMGNHRTPCWKYPSHHM